MRINVFLKKGVRDFKMLVDKEQITVCRERKQGLDIRAYDSRTYFDNGHWHVYPVAKNDCQVCIICPFCGQVHFHGLGEGHRVAHCYGESKGYLIVYEIGECHDPRRT